MANQKSQIYPIQLQGAELNLNKFDGEIKQYSGFNKNNSPFVGGCLSNIFTKDETIEGATSQNTYIAPNGDVYRVNTEGLWKNEEKLIDTTGKDFFNVIDLDTDFFPTSTVYVYDEETYIYIKDKKYFYHSGKVDHDFLSPYNETVNINKYPFIDFRIKKLVISNTEYELVSIFFNNQSKPDVFSYINIYKKTETGTLESVYTLKLDGTRFNSTVFQNSYFSRLSYIIKTQGDNYTDFRIIVLTCGDNVVTSTNSKNNYEIGFDGSQISVISSLFVTDAEGRADVGADLINYRFTDKFAIRCNSQLLTNLNYHRGVKSTYTIDLENKKIILNDEHYSSGVNFIQSNGKYNIIKEWGILCAQLENTENSSAYNYTIDDDVTNFAYNDNNASFISYKVQFNLGGILNDCVLVNNLLASGLSLPGGMQLVTEWNTVDLDYIFFGDNTEEWHNDKYVYIWKDTRLNKWHKLVKSEPLINRINDQIIINSNSDFNAVRISDNKALLFAPAWNNRRPYTFNSNRVSKVVRYMATSINEYDLAENSSIIINPVLTSGNITIGQNVDAFPKDINNYILANIYSGIDTNVLYRASQDLVTKNIVLLDSLKDLPFPTNTDGNVQYSPSLFATEKGKYGNLVFISEGGTAYKLMTYNNKAVMSYFLTTAIEGLQDFFTIQGQLYGILDNQIYNFSIVNEIANRGDFIVSVEGLQFVGNTPYEALFFSKTNRCLYSFTGANVLHSKQFVDKISEVRNYKYNPATQSIFLITDIGVIVYSLFGIYQIEFLNCQDMYLLNNGVILTDNEGTFKYIKYYKEETTEDYIKENIQLETMFYGMNNQTVTINDCLYMRIFSEEHEEDNLEVSATTLSLEGRMTEKTTFKIKESDWDKMTHTIYLRYQPKEQRGLGISFSINSPFKIASLSIGSQQDAVLVDKVSKGAINAPQQTSNNDKW